MLKLQLIRTDFDLDHTHGSLAYLKDKKWHELCHTLEDVTRDINKDGDLNDKDEGKIYGQTAIPFGTYKGILRYSQKRKRAVPELLNVPHFTNIQIHSGNTTKDTLGCILVGYKYDSNKAIIYESRNAERDLVKLIEQHNSEFEIEII